MKSLTSSVKKIKSLLKSVSRRVSDGTKTVLSQIHVMYCNYWIANSPVARNIDNIRLKVLKNVYIIIAKYITKQYIFLICFLVSSQKALGKPRGQPQPSNVNRDSRIKLEWEIQTLFSGIETVNLPIVRMAHLSGLHPNFVCSISCLDKHFRKREV